eukprot:jgi/Galph1/4437/GphlegSOOS_G3046.1
MPSTSWLQVTHICEEIKHLSRFIPDKRKGKRVRQKVRRLYKLYDQRAAEPGAANDIVEKGKKIMQGIRLRWPSLSESEPLQLDQTIEERLSRK